MAKKRKTTGGGGAPRMKEFGYRLVAVWLDKTEYALVSAAALRQGKRLATYVRSAAVGASVIEHPGKEE